MPRFRVLTPEASPTHFFGSEVRRAREEAGMSQTDLGDLVPCDKGTVSRIEGGLTAPDEAFARACDAAFPHMTGWFTRFLRDSGGWAAAVAPSFRPFAEDEARASALLISEHSVIPGLLQTAAYARAVLASHPGVNQADVESRVAARMARQAILDREDPPALWILLDELVLYREIGGPEVMRDQLRHLVEMTSRIDITVQLLTAPYHAGLQGAINIAEKPGAQSVAYIEEFTDGRLDDNRATVLHALDRFRHLQSEALTGSASRELIKRLAEQRCSQGQQKPGGWQPSGRQPSGGSAASAAVRAATAWKSAEPTP